MVGALGDPTLELFSANGERIGMNDDWKLSQQAEIEGTSLAPRNELESAIVTTLLPGNYTAIVRGFEESTGVALVEVYHLQ